jgi:hypothetical protein
MIHLLISYYTLHSHLSYPTLQIQENQRTAIFNEEITDYTMGHCTEDRDYFNKWEKTQPQWKDKPHDGHGAIFNQPKQCFEYSKYISNLPIYMTVGELPTLEDLYRKKRMHLKK